MIPLYAETPIVFDYPIDDPLSIVSFLFGSVVGQLVDSHQLQREVFAHYRPNCQSHRSCTISSTLFRNTYSIPQMTDSPSHLCFVIGS
jgi:hypothetical protein